MNNFAVFILTHGRADNVKTYDSLKRCGYTGKIYILIDNEDSTCDMYYERFGDEVIMFDKPKEAEAIDVGDNFDGRTAIVYARNACFRIAKELGIKYFLQLDDDFKSFQWRYAERRKMKVIECRHLDKLFEHIVQFLESSGALTVALAQGGDFIGGVKANNFKKSLLRKAMNTFFCSVDRPFKFFGRLSEDVCAYTVYGSRGDLMFTIPKVMITQVPTQAGKGGISEVYLTTGTYVKSFYPVMYSPSCVKISMMGDNHKRIHHKVIWNNCCPKIIDEKWRKTSEGKYNI